MGKLHFTLFVQFKTQKILFYIIPVHNNLSNEIFYKNPTNKGSF